MDNNVCRVNNRSIALRTCPICDLEYEDSAGACPHHDANAVYDPLVGTTINDRYLIKEIIGRGSMGSVYKALQVADEREVALKILHAHLACDTESVKRFQHEARAASSLMHPNIVRLFDVGATQRGQPYIAMELLPGITLADYIKTKGSLKTSEALPIIRQVCEALADAHGNGVVHRDIKPANIMLCNRFGQENFVLVLDFSIAKVIQRVSDVYSTNPGLIVGSPAYMSPERFMGKGGDFRSDIYSLGIIMFQMLSGTTPFKSSDLYTLMNAHIKEPPPSILSINPQSDIPEDLEASITRSLQKKPEDRQANMKQLLLEIYEVYRNGAERSSRQRLENSAQNIPVYISAADATATAAAGEHATTSSGEYARNPQRSAGRRRSDSSSYEIDPGATLTEPTQRKSDSGTNGIDLAASGRWRNVGNKNASERRISIRFSEEKRRIQVELIAVLAIILCGIAAIIGLSLSAQKISENKQKTEQLFHNGNIEAAGTSLQQWQVRGVSASDQESFSQLCMEIGRNYMSKQLLASAAIYFEMVPPTSHLYPEAQLQARKCHKAFNL